MAALSLRRMWTTYKRLMIESGICGKRELALAHEAFYAGARGTLKVLSHLIEHGDDAELRRTLEHHGRQLRALQGRRSKARRH
jgi:hypothetical protein